MNWKAKAKAQKRELESLRPLLKQYRRATEAALWLAIMLRQERQQCDADMAGDSAPLLHTSTAVKEALRDFDLKYRDVNPAAWYPTVKTVLTA